MDLHEYNEDVRPNRVIKFLKVAAIVIGLVVVLLACLAFFARRYVQQELKPMPPSDSAVRFTIPAGSGSTEITHILQKNGIIRNSTIFWYYLKYSNQGTQFKAGTYEMKPGITNAQMIERLNKGDVVKLETLRFTIPEGFTVQQIADKLSSQNIAEKTNFIKLADAGTNYPCTWTAEIPGDKAIKHRLEGYLYPDTYEMKKGSSTTDILQRMLCEWDNKLSQLPSGWQSQMQEHKLNFHQLLTLASLIEREVVVEQERSIVAGIIYNRLNKKMPLQIDATVQYLFDQPKERLFEKDLKIESPYNTYLHTGLPPGPIASPSIASIKAALYPDANKYLYYVTKKDGSHSHLFAETLEQHNNNIAKSLAKN